MVIESTGRFTSETAASAHIKAGARKQLWSAHHVVAVMLPIVLGANGRKYFRWQWANYFLTQAVPQTMQRLRLNCCRR